MSAVTTLLRVMLLCALALGTGCALFSKAEPLDVRYFAPTVEPSSQTGATREDVALRLGKVTAAPYLDRRIVYRATEQELGYHPTLRWTEQPDAYLRRALTQELFEARGVTQVVSGVAPTLSVELIAFEEVEAPKHVARMTVRVTLEDGRVARFSRTFSVERPIEEDDPRATVSALGEAPAVSVERIANDVIAALPAKTEGGERVQALSLDP